MLRFWRRLRQKLIGEHKAKAYVLYAAGEILLIVVGILIAFQVSNWDTRKQEQRRALDLVRNLRGDLVRDTANFNELSGMYGDLYKKRRRVLGPLDFNALPGDSIMDLVTPLYLTVDFVTPTYHKMENIGLTELAGFGNLFDRVNAYYTTVQNNYLNLINWDAESSLHEARYWYYHPGFENYYHELFAGEPLPAVQSEADRKKELIRLLGTPEVRNMLRTSAMRKHAVLQVIGETREYASGLLAAIDSALAGNTSPLRNAP